MATYMIIDTSKIKKTTFRSFVLALFASLLYDILWIMMVYADY